MLPLRCATVWRHSRRWLFGTPGAVLTRPHLVLLGGWVLPEAQHANIRSLNGVGWVVPRERSSSGSTTTLNCGAIVYAAAPGCPVAVVCVQCAHTSSVPAPLPMRPPHDRVTPPASA